MKTIFSVLVEITPDASGHSSYPAGVWEVDFSDDREKAERTAEICNRHTMLKGARYRVEEVGEESPERKPMMPKKI